MLGVYYHHTPHTVADRILAVAGGRSDCRGQTISLGAGDVVARDETLKGEMRSSKCMKLPYARTLQPVSTPTPTLFLPSSPPFHIPAPWALPTVLVNRMHIHLTGSATAGSATAVPEFHDPARPCITRLESLREVVRPRGCYTGRPLTPEGVLCLSI